MPLPQPIDVTAVTPAADGFPAKEFFINVITKDIGLERAILDLVDNSVDGARLLRAVDPGEDRTRPSSRYEGLWINLMISGERFIISDNCGGIPLDVAQQRAFKFGRSPQSGPGVQVPHSIGLFGIGMKRALFKLGRHFTVESTSARSHFVIDQDVAVWQARDLWDFPFRVAERYEEDIPEESRGTTVTVTQLHPTVTNDFERENWRSALVSELRDALREPIAGGLTATVNGVAIAAERPVLYQSERIRPYVSHFCPESDPRVSVRIYAGVAAGDLDRAGWYVFCNDRLVISGDQSALTGWGAKEPVKVPKYHNQFHRFFGYVYLDSEDPALLPWNTTKTGIDTDSPLWRSVRNQMILAMKPVIEFLNALRKEEKSKSATVETQTRHKPLLREFAIAADEKADINSLVGDTSRFVWPEVPTEIPGPKEVLIKYTRTESEIETAMRFFRVDSPSEAGLRTFLYWQRAEL